MVNLCSDEKLEHDQKMLNNIGNDWYLIAISKCVRANCIITYDKHLLSLKNELKEKERVDVLTSEEFIQLFKIIKSNAL